MALCCIAAYLVCVKVRPAVNTGGIAPVEQFFQIPLVVLAGIGRETAFGLQVLQKPVYPVLGGGRHVVVGR